MNERLLFNLDLDDRRRQLGMTFPALAERSGIPTPTVKRVLGGGYENASFQTIVRIAEAMGMVVSGSVERDAQELRMEQARVKARKYVDMLQGTSALEGQAVSEHTLLATFDDFVHELLNSDRKLWPA